MTYTLSTTNAKVQEPGPCDPPDLRDKMDVRQWKPYQVPQPFRDQLDRAREYRQYRSLTGD